MENHGVPIEIFLKILQFLPHQQLLWCKQVNREWYWIISTEVRFKELVLSNTSHFNRRWYQSYEIVSSNCLIKLPDSNLELCILKHAAFAQLRHLYLYSKMDQPPRKLNVGVLVNHLNQLETLELVGWISNEPEDNLVLSNLRTLNIDRFQFDLLVVDCPNLSKLRYVPTRAAGLFNDLEFKHPENVKSLELQRLESKWVETFTELEELWIDHIYNIGSELLEQLPMLKEIHFGTDDVSGNYETLLEQKRRYKRSDFRIYCHEFAFHTEASLEELPFLDDAPNFREVQFIRNHCAKFVEINQIYVLNIHLNVLEDCFRDGIPEELIRKFVNLQSLRVDRVVKNEQQFGNILKILGRSLNQLEIVSSSLSQNFFDLLPGICSILIELSIQEKHAIDPNFLLGFKSLIRLTFLQELTREFVETVFNKYESLNLFNFNYRKGKSVIRVRLERKCLSDPKVFDF